MASYFENFESVNEQHAAFPVFEDIRRRGKLCDVTLKVHISWLIGLSCER